MTILLLNALLLVATATTAVGTPASEQGKHLQVYGFDAARSRIGEGDTVAEDGVVSAEALGWRGLYDKPFVLAVQQDNRPELAAFLVKSGLSSLPHSEDMNFLHNVLRSAGEQVGILLSATKFVNAPQVEMPITKFFLPKDYTLAVSARLQSEHQGFPTMLLLKKSDLAGFELDNLSLIGDFRIYEDSVKVASDVAASTLGHSTKKTVNRSPQFLLPTYISEVSPQISPYEYRFVLPRTSSISVF